MSSFRYLLMDPFFEVTPVQAHGIYDDDAVKKSIRKYMPRTYAELVGAQDVMYMTYSDRRAFTSKMINWLASAVVEDGLGLSIVGEGSWNYREWIKTTQLGTILPVEVTRDLTVRREVKIRVLKPLHPLISGLPYSDIGDYGIFGGYTPVGVKEGSETLYDLVPVMGFPNPGVVCWDIGQGRSITSTNAGNMRYTEWKFFPDAASNRCLFLAGREVPPNIAVLHEIRRILWNLDIARRLLISYIEFISKMGGNTVSLEAALANTEMESKEVDLMYIAHDFESSLSLAKRLLTKMGEASDLAVKVKNQTLLWIFIVEWFIITGTGLFAGSLMWALMVRRRLYKEVMATRLGKKVGT
jgi:hypothetical protein